MPYFLFTLLGFVLGSTLFAYWIPKLLKNIDICTLPDDHNPGVSNAFMYGGFLCGILSLICELAKGFIPVYLGQKYLDINSLPFVPVLVAPVFGHAFPFLQKEKGGGIMSTRIILPKTEESKKKRTAAYCRVSSSSEEQLRSYAAQVKFYTEMLSADKSCEFVGVYADEGITGTSRVRRNPQKTRKSGKR